MKASARLSLWAATVVLTGYAQAWGADGSQAATTQPESRPARDAQTLSGTIVTPSAEQEIVKEKNILWCATFQMAWDELRKLNKAPVQTAPGCPMVDLLNRETLPPGAMPLSGAFALAGPVSEGVIQEAIRRYKEANPNGSAPPLLPQANALPPDAVVAYAYLLRTMRFKTPFAPLGEMSFIGESPSGPAQTAPATARHSEVSFFGIDKYSPASETSAEQAAQVRILWHRFSMAGDSIAGQEFIVELLTDSPEDRLILAQVTPARTLRATIDDVLRRIQNANSKTAMNGLPPEMYDALSPPTGVSRRDAITPLSAYSCLLLDESLWVPLIRLDIDKNYAELRGQVVQSGAPILQGKPIVEGKQLVRFGLDETGAQVESAVYGGIFGSAHLRDFFFRKPFLVMLMRKDAVRPYFALWVANAELLVAH